MACVRVDFTLTARRLFAENDEEPDAGEAISMLVQGKTSMSKLRRMQHV